MAPSFSIEKLVGLGRFELPTSPLSGVRSNQLSYRPIKLCVGLLPVGNRPAAPQPPLFNERKATARSLFPESAFDQAMRVSTYETGEVSIKEVIQPQVPLRLPCYDFTPVMNHTVVTVLRS